MVTDQYDNPSTADSWFDTNCIARDGKGLFVLIGSSTDLRNHFRYEERSLGDRCHINNNKI